jgi:dTMP kinase
LSKGLFITFEGTEGSGKTTQAELLGEKLSHRQPVVVREPGGTELGERIRQLLLSSGMVLDGEAEMNLFMAARRQLLTEVIKPSLALGRIVIADRYHDSTFAYQGGGRGVTVVWPASFPRPDMTFLLALPVLSGRERQQRAGKSADRVEQESIEFHNRVSAAYDRLAAAEPDRITRIDASESREAVHHKVWSRVGPAVEAMS